MAKSLFFNVSDAEVARRKEIGKRLRESGLVERLFNAYSEAQYISRRYHELFG